MGHYKMKKIILIISIIWLTFSCTLKKEDIIDKIVQQENEILNQLFCEMVFPLVPPPNDTSEIGLVSYEKEVKRIMDSIQYEIYLVDSLIVPDRSYFHNFDISNEFQILYEKLKNESIIKPRKLDKDIFKVKSNYKLITDFKVDSTFQEKVMQHNLIGVIKFSRVSFNYDFSKACFYQSISCGHGCGGGLFIFAERLNNRWRIVLKHLIWVS